MRAIYEDDVIKMLNDGWTKGIYPSTANVRNLPTAKLEIIRCKDCKYWNDDWDNKYWINGSCEYREHAVNTQGYMIGDIETEAEHFCGYAEKREANSND